MECRFDSLDFDIATSAGWYSAIAGLLAGFALLAILLPLDHDSNQQEGAEEGVGATESVVIFTCAFFSLLILGVTYAILAGRSGDGPALGIAAHEQLLNGAAFGLATPAWPPCWSRQRLWQRAEETLAGFMSTRRP